MNKGKNNKTIFSLIGAACIVAVILLMISLAGKKIEQESVRVGVIMSGGIEETGWNGMHYNGLKQASDKLGIELLIEEHVKEFSGECTEAIEELVEQGAEMIILTSYNYSEEAKELVKEYPQIVFYVNSSEHHDTNMTSYFVRMYQARYLSGIIAGMKTEGNQIGYVAAMPNNEVNRGINAFTLGVKRVNPEAQVVVTYTGEWDNKEKEMEAANNLIQEEQVDVITYHQNQPNVVEAAEQAGIYSIAYHETMKESSANNLTTVQCSWELVYEAILREFMVGKSNIQDNYWIGLEAEAVGLSEYSELVSEDIKKEIEAAKNEILAGKDVFSGIIYDTEGSLRCDEKEFISDENLLEHMDWYVEGVRFYER